jgi:hypothetical protein
MGGRVTDAETSGRNINTYGILRRPEKPPPSSTNTTGQPCK